MCEIFESIYKIRFVVAKSIEIVVIVGGMFMSFSGAVAGAEIA
jgi:hypothetical protein